MKDRHVNENVGVVVLASATRETYAAGESQRIQQTVMRELLLASNEPYHKVQVRVRHRTDGSPEGLIAYMLRAYTYTADIVKVNVDQHYRVRSVETSYVEDAQDYAGFAFPPVSLPRRQGPDMVFGTPVPEIPTAKAAVEYACKLATSAGYTVKKLLGQDASLANYSTYLTGHLKAFGSVGHGYTGGIVLADGNLTSQWFAGLSKSALSPEVIYFNSCQVFNAPLQPAIMGAGARTFAGGKINLLIGASEEVFKCFWTKVLQQAEKMGPALQSCEKEKYPTPNAHGIGGDLGVFKKVIPVKPKPKAKAKAKRK